MKLIVVSGGFDPIHSGHIAYFNSAKSYGDKLIVALNSDTWLEKKKGKFFMPFDERKVIVESIKFVDEVIGFEDDDKGSCINALEEIKKCYPNNDIYFANGGDRDKKNIPEMSVSGINFLFGIGGNDKKNSSSWILNRWQYYFEERQWGSFFNLFEAKNIKVKELIVKPGKSMSFQRHFKRNEIWLVSEGSCTVSYSNNVNYKDIKELQLHKFDHYLVPVGHWHQISNSSNTKTHIIEIQYGEDCSESDIERVDIT
ncbi:adenylyltransferase/cytidyltransferase family protein [Gammaproteobacteria bacterium]|nr:adenylyltransferase/cytidyltransferase family protein [Gammaproteobacteria bacterium]MDC3306820.1 adenylyltransferase/cytidyltransferase family protein [Gammaproteobacteria bacterium]